MFQDSQYQLDIYKVIKKTQNSIAVSAVAGSGKTTTIVRMIEFIPRSADIFFGAFNKHIVKELTERLPNHVTVSTLHSFGARMIIMNYGPVAIVENKVFNIACKKFESWREQVHAGEKKFSYAGRVAKIVDFMRYNLVEEYEEVEEMIERYNITVFGNEIYHAQEVLKESTSLFMEQIDFADMIYIPAIRDKMKLKKFNFVLIDEAQDLNKAQQTMIRKMIHPRGGRLIAVGDPRQAIYSFAGADIDSYENIKKLVPNVVEMPLSVCYRCPPEGVEHAKEIVPHIEASPYKSPGILNHNGSVNDVDEKCLVVCRNTRPLVQLLVILLEKGLKANIKGKEIGKNIINTIDKTNQKTVPGLIKHLEAHRVILKSKLKARGVVNLDGHHQMVDYVEKMEIIRILSKRFQTVKQLKAYIDTVFLDEDIPGVVLSTIHKAKGLEADKVFFLNSFLIPSQFAVTTNELIQESNLMYVARTRHKKELHYINIIDEAEGSQLLELLKESKNKKKK